MSVIRLLSKLPRHSEQLQISRDSRKIEDVLNEKLIMLVQSIQKLEKQDQFTEFLANDYREKVNTSFRQAVERIYQVAGTYASEFTNREYFTTTTDLGHIQRLSFDYMSIFYDRLSRHVINSTEEKPIRPEFIVKMTTANMTQDTLRQAIIAKSQQILTPPAIITTAAEGDNEIVYVWITSQDDKVCPICSGYEGQAWAFDNSASIPDIPDDTHPNCRCVIQLAEAVL
jgi:hypothetical protein